MKKMFAAVVIVFLVFFSLTESGICSSVSDIQISPASPSALPFNQDVNISFNYSTSEAGGIRIFVRPMTNGALASNYAASGSPLYPSGSGSGSGNFTITSNETTIDQVSFQIYNADQSLLLVEFFVPVFFYFNDSPTSITNIQTASPSPASLEYNQRVNIAFDYSTAEAGGIRIFARPITNGALTPNYAASGSPLYPTGSGSGSGDFTITSGETTVDYVRFRITNDDQSVLLTEFLLPVQYAFPVQFALTPPSPVLTISQSGGSVILDWTSIPNATGYIIGYAPYPDIDYIEVIDAGKATSFSFDLLFGSVAYYVIVVPYNNNGWGSASNVEFFTAP
ncbi:MAG: fibronectin type III domain-containing protein [Desulfobacterales bacterium]